MLINFTNHPSAKWTAEQLTAANVYGEIRDIPFPEVDPDGRETYISELADKYVAQIMAFDPNAVLCQGEMTLAFAVAARLVEFNVTTLAACSKREVSENIGANGETVKHAEFRFIRFRKYFI
ncbi:hypothetical protein FACS1894187_13590 [Synergistales bacterium]|nr:hypothetical protein FACS1894187_13590 [Synergistales bacterium]